MNLRRALSYHSRPVMTSTVSAKRQQFGTGNSMLGPKGDGEALPGFFMSQMALRAKEKGRPGRRCPDTLQRVRDLGRR
jgi:hypothetical protein